jgi:5-deoxy-glucuronate isomerase
MSTSILVKGRERQEGYGTLATPENSPLRWLSCGRLGVVQGNPFEGYTGEQEWVVDILDGVVTLEAEGTSYRSLGDRTMPYGGPTLVCLPPHVHYQIASHVPIADMFLVSADADAGQTVTVVKPEDAPVRHVGKGNWERHVWPGTAVASGTRRLIVGETINPPGNWSSFPPHKHDANNPPEGVYEEIYFFLVRPQGGFGLSRIYERREAVDALNETVVVEDVDMVFIPRGYHTVVAAPGYELRYVWALCGMERFYGAWRDDPEYVWVRDEQAPPPPVEME